MAQRRYEYIKISNGHCVPLVKTVLQISRIYTENFSTDDVDDWRFWRLAKNYSEL
jgi:hypothetical protein